MERHLELSAVTKTFDTPQGPYTALWDCRLAVARGEFVSLIGHSGCGKSTLLSIVAGLARPTTGGVILDGKEVTEPGPDRGMVFQQHALLPWLSAFDNVLLAGTRTNSQAGCVSAWGSPGRWPCGPRCCCWTSPSARSTP